MPNNRPVPLILVPWLEGGGAQLSLENILKRHPGEADALIIFTGSRNFESIVKVTRRLESLELPRGAKGVVKSRSPLANILKKYQRVYSLARASTATLGLQDGGLLRQLRICATFHQLPSLDESGDKLLIEKFFIRRALAYTQLVTAPTERACSELTSLRYCPAEKVIHVPNIREMGSEPIRPPSNKIQQRQIKLAFAGRLTDQKNLLLIEELLTEEAPAIHLRIAGDGPQRANIETLATQLPLKHNVELLGHISGVSELLDWCDLAFMPSKAELDPYFLHEAWARGRAVLASDIDTFSDLSKRGPVAQFGNPSQFRDILTALTDSSLATMSKRAASVKSQSTPNAIESFLFQ